MKNSYVGTVVGAALGFVAGAGFAAGKPDAREHEPVAKAQANTPDSRDVRISADLARRAKLQVQRVKMLTLAPSLRLVGSVNFDQDAVADVGARIDGRITRVLASVGDSVQRGDPLVELESNELGKVIAELLAARANLSAAQNQAQREADLGEKQLSTARAVERATAEASALRAEVQGLEQRLRAMGLTEQELSRLARGTIPRSITLRAPIAGQIVERYAVLGQVVDPTHPVLRVADLSQLWVELDVFERDLEQVGVGSEVEIFWEANPGKVLRGAVTYVDATIDLTTRSARVRVEVQNPERLLRPGEFVLARLTTQTTKRDVIGIPRRAVVRLDGVPSVFLSVRDETYLARPVELGAASGDHVEVIRGLVEGDLIVTEGAFVLKSELER